MNKPTDLSEDLPADAQNDELAQFAAQLKDVLPALAPDSLARVQAKMDAELDRSQSRHGWRRAALGWSVAAAVALSLIGYTAWRGGREVVAPEVPPAFVQERINVAFSEAVAPADAGRPLVALDDYRSLFTD